MTVYDYIVVGAGSAGCVLANRLSIDPSISVLLLEAGGRDNNLLFSMPAGFAKMTKGIASWGYSTVPQRHLGGRVLRYTQAKVLGGGSSINAQVYTRGNARDYDGWAAAGATRTSCRISSSPKTTSASSTPTMRAVVRSASRCPSTRCRSARLFCEPGRNMECPTIPISTVPGRRVSGTIR